MRVRERENAPIDQTLGYLQYRTTIVDWMCEVAEEFKLNPYAVQLSVHYFDLTLQRVKVKKSQLQLVAMCCTLLAGALPPFLVHLADPNCVVWLPADNGFLVLMTPHSPNCLTWARLPSQRNSTGRKRRSLRSTTSTPARKTRASASQP